MPTCKKCPSHPELREDRTAGLSCPLCFLPYGPDTVDVPRNPFAFPNDQTGRYDMRLRDWFAAYAMNALLSDPGQHVKKKPDGSFPTTSQKLLAEKFAEFSYVIADAMLREREKPV